MAITLTESRLRQIIREEAAKLSRPPTRNLREGKFNYSTKLSYLHEALDALEQAQVHEQSSATGNDPDLDSVVAGLRRLLEGTMAASGHRMAGPGQQLPPVPGRLPEGKSLVEAYRRGRGGGGVTRRSSNEDDQIAHIMRERGVNYERAEQILTDIYDDVGHDDGLVADAVYGHPMDYDED